MKNIFKYILLVLVLFLSYSHVSFAYEFQDEKNKRKVNSIISEIYNSKEEYEELAGSYEEQEDSINLMSASSDSYWWPIGSVDTVENGGRILAKGDPETTNITSNFGNRNNPTGNGVKFHSGLDISGGRGLNQTNIIASKSGIVVYPTADIKNDCPYNAGASSCGGGYGNYVIIQHPDGNYTLYGHMNEGTILVTAGDSVEQGQVIGKMGSSGNSTGPHLHFEVRVGNNAYSSAVNPLDYIDPSNPRPTTSVVSGDSYQQTACLTLKSLGYDDSAVAAILQNMSYESGIIPNNMENSYERKIGHTDESYTAAVDNGTYTNFVHDAVGYGLVQWTASNRKQGLLDYSKEVNSSIGDIGMQLQYFEKELISLFPSVENNLRNVQLGYSDKVEYFCLKFENPYNASYNCAKRAAASSQFVSYVENGCQ